MYNVNEGGALTELCLSASSGTSPFPAGWVSAGWTITVVAGTTFFGLIDQSATLPEESSTVLPLVGKAGPQAESQISSLEQLKEEIWGTYRRHCS